MTYLDKLKWELAMAHANNGWYNAWLIEKINEIENGKSKSNS